MNWKIIFGTILAVLLLIGVYTFLQRGNSDSLNSNAISTTTTVQLTGSTPQALGPKNTTYTKQDYTNYGGKPANVSLPTYEYDFQKVIIKISFSLDGQDKYGHLYYKATIQTDTKTIGAFTTTDSLAPDTVYIHGDDIIFAWQSFERSGAAATSHKEGLIVFNTVSGLIDSEILSQEEGQPGNIKDFFTFAVKNDSIYALAKVPQLGQTGLYKIKEGKISPVASEQ